MLKIPDQNNLRTPKTPSTKEEAKTPKRQKQIKSLQCKKRNCVIMGI